MGASASVVGKHQHERLFIFVHPGIRWVILPRYRSDDAGELMFWQTHRHLLKMYLKERSPSSLREIIFFHRC